MSCRMLDDAGVLSKEENLTKGSTQNRLFSCAQVSTALRNCTVLSFLHGNIARA